MRFEPKKLAYLALTSKPELQIRDRIAWRLHTAGLSAAREWHRVDLAVLDDRGTPLALIESKAIYSFDAQRYMARYDALVRADIEKARSLAARYATDTEVFALVVVTHVTDGVGPGRQHPVKYESYLRQPADLNLAERNLRTFLESLGHVHRHRLEQAQVFDLATNVDAWLCGPVVPAPMRTRSCNMGALRQLSRWRMRVAARVGKAKVSQR